MKILKTLLVVLLLIVLAAVILGLAGPKRCEVSRSTVVQAPVAVVYGHANSLQRMGEWSPWNKRDPDIQISYSGPDGVVGQTSSWTGNADVGAGEQEITALVPGRKVGLALRFKEPFASTATADLDLEAMGDSTRVTWAFGSDNNFISRIFSVFMDMDKMIGPDFAQGLASLKSLAEADAEAAAATTARMGGFTMNLVERPQAVYAGRRATVAWSGLDAFFNKAFAAAFGAAGKAGVKVTGPATGLYYNWDEANKQAELLAGIPVDPGQAAALKGLDVETVPAGRAWLLEFRGNPDRTMAAHMALDSLLKVRGAELRPPVMEEYLFDPRQEPDTAKWVTNILYYVK